MVANGVLRQELGAPMKGRVARRICRLCDKEVGFLKNELCLNCYATAKKKGHIPMTDISTPQKVTPEAQAAGAKSYATDAEFRTAVAESRSAKDAAQRLGMRYTSVNNRIKRLKITPPWSSRQEPAVAAKQTNPPTVAPPTAPVVSPPPGRATAPDITAIIGGLPYNLGRAIEYLVEAAQDGDPESLEKAQALVGRELERMEV